MSKLFGLLIAVAVSVGYVSFSSAEEAKAPATIKCVVTQGEKKETKEVANEDECKKLGGTVEK